MDRRTLLAFFLVFLVITGYQLMTSREAQKRGGMSPAPPTTAIGDTPATTPTERTTDHDLIGDVRDDRWSSTRSPSDVHMTPASALEPVDKDLVERTVTVRTPLYEVVLAGRGARITSWLGLQYTDRRGVPAQLIPQDDQAAPHGLDAIIFNGREFDLGQWVFSTEEPSRIEVMRASRSVLFRLQTAGDLEVRKTYTFDPDSYEITIETELADAGPLAGQTRSALGHPRSIRFGWGQGIASTEPGDRMEKESFRSFAGLGETLEIRKRGAQVRSVERAHDKFEGTLRFAGIQNKYFTVVGLPARDADQVQTAEVVLSGDPQRNVQTWTIELPVRPAIAGTDAWGAGGIALYIGPQITEQLKAYGVGLEKTMNLGWALFRPLTEATLWIMAQMRRVIPNYGVIIILFSVLTKVAFYPLTRTSTRSMKRMQQLQPKIKELQEKNKDNREKQSQEMMKLYKKEKINPMAGCLPMLLQMPVFISLYQALAHTIALRNTPFFGWINDLSKPDALFTLPFSLPFLGADFSFNLLPLLMTATMVVQMRMTPTGTAPAQMAMMNTLMPVVFLFFFYQMPSGLVLYWLVNNVVTIYQTWRIHKTASPEGGSKTT